MPDYRSERIEEQLARMSWDSRTSHDGLVLRKSMSRPEIRIEGSWPRGASRHEIAAALRNLAARLEAYEDE